MTPRSSVSSRISVGNWSAPELQLLATSLHRRKLIATGTVSALLAGLPTLTRAQTPVSGEWLFTDDKGATISLPETPQRIIADLIAAAALWDFGIRPVAVFGWDVNADDSFNVAGGRVDPEAVEVAGNVSAPFEPERALATEPDLIVTLDGGDDPDAYWSIDPDVVNLAREIAPIVAIDPALRLDLVVSRFAELAIALGADPENAELAEARAAAEQAAADFASTVESKAGLQAMFIVGMEDSLYVANPKVASDLIYFRELGLDIPDLDVEDTEYWETLDWEQSLKYPVDLVFYSTRTGMTADELKAHPVFGLHPAVAAGQIAPWNGEEPLSYQGIATTLGNTRSSIGAASVLDD